MKKKTFRISLFYQYAPVAILCLTMFFVVRNWEVKNLKNSFQSTANEFTLTLQDTINIHIEVLHSIRSFCEAFHISQGEFDSFISPMLEKYPSIHSISWMPNIAQDTEKEQTADDEQTASSPLPVGIYPSGIVLGSPRFDEHYPSYYGENSDNALPTDSQYGSIMLETFLKARDTGLAVTPPKIHEQNNDSIQYNSFILLAVYTDDKPARTIQERRTNIKGFLISAFRIPDILPQKLLSTTYRQMKFSLSDITDTDDEKYLYWDSARKKPDNEQGISSVIPDAFSYSKKIILGQGSWLVTCSLPQEKVSMSVWQSRAILILGLLFTGLLFLYISINQKMTVKLKASEHRFRSLTTLSPIGIFQTDTKGKVVYVNERWSTITGLSPEQSYKNGWLPHLYSADKKRVIDEWQETIVTTGQFASQFRLQPTEDTLTWVFGCAIPWHDDKGITQGYIGTMEDITEHKNMFQALQEKEEYLRTVFDAAPTGIFLIDPATKHIVDMNLTAQSYLDLAETTAKSNIPYTKVYPFNTVSLETGTIVEQSESTIVSFNKDEIAVLRNIVPVIQHGKPYLLESFMDITEQKTLQRQLLKSQNMASVGSLAAGVAHEFNNILLIISGFAKLNSDSTKIDELQNALSTIAETTHRGEKIVGSLLSLARHEHTEKKQLCNLNTVLQQDIILLDKELRKNSIELLAHLEDVPDIPCFPHRLSQVFINMIKNAIHAMHDSEKKQLTVALWHGTKTQQIKSKHITRSKEYIFIAISDTGHGMSQEVRERIFEPFFTTKGVLSGGSDSTPGTGLGLSISYGIIEEHNGMLSVESAENAGATFTIAIPVTQQHSPTKSVT